MQEDALIGTDIQMMCPRKKLNKLAEIGKNLILKNPTSRVNLEMGLFEPIEKCGTNEDRLKWYKNN